jgi:hypothetical protein
MRGSLAAAQQVSLEEPCPQESRAGNHGCHKMQVWQVVGLLVCWEHETLPELEGVALLVFLEPTCLPSAQQVSLEVGPLAFPVVSNVLLECQVEHCSILHRMQE